MTDSEKSKSCSARLWKALVAERTAALVDRREARIVLVPLIAKELDTQAVETVDAVQRVPNARLRRRIQTLL